MPTEVLMPALSPTMEKGKLAKWLKKEGDTVKSGDVIAEIETDKATMEVEAADEGTLGKILVPEGTDRRGGQYADRRDPRRRRGQVGDQGRQACAGGKAAQRPRRLKLKQTRKRPAAAKAPAEGARRTGNDSCRRSRHSRRHRDGRP